jgi:hypothetical protein
MTARAVIRRCAVYTRKSSEEGLEQDFNSLHAQREACEAFIRSQRAEGWRLIETAYDDGGLSGGTLERPALQHLLADITQRRVDTVVVYKVDRLTRSLTDFAKPDRPGRMLRPGTVLIRQWQGATHHVTVGGHGVLYRGERYRSLSAVARLITGARWSGPRFFGLRA